MGNSNEPRSNDYEYRPDNRRSQNQEDPDEEMPYCSAFLQKILILISYITSIVFNALSNSGRFGISIGALSYKYNTYITPPDFTFLIWALIYGLWGIYILFQLLPNSCLGNARATYSHCFKGKRIELSAIIN
jgi:hypothetical protein